MHYKCFEAIVNNILLLAIMSHIGASEDSMSSLSDA